MVPSPRFAQGIPLRYRIIAILLFCAAGLNAGVLDSAWVEYQYQNWSRSRKLFSRAAKIHEAGSDEMLQVRLGHALIDQHKMPHPQPEKAIAVYTAMLSELGETHQMAPALHLLLGRASSELDEPDINEAYRHLDVLVNATPLVFESGEALVDRTTIMLRTPTDKSIAEVTAYVHEQLPRFAGHPMEVVLHQLCASLELLQGNLVEARARFVRVIELGVPNERDREKFLLQVAAISERALDDPQTALEYYRRFTNEVLSSVTLHHCRTKVLELEELLR